jgi:glucan phosphoethanolaminetransferase (alkaline phosphatase superfamily)
MHIAKPLVPVAGFLAGFAPVVFWHYLHWAPLGWSILAGVAVAVLFSVIWVIPRVSPAWRKLAAIVLVLIAVAYVVIVIGILSVSDCGFIDGQLYCINRHF